MKIALAHDWLNTKLGGAEHVLLELADLFPEAPIYTLVYSPELSEKIPAGRVITSSLQSKPEWLKRHSKYLLPMIPAAVEGLDFSGYDLVISSSGAWMKNILTPTETKHLCYCHSPMRFVWDYWPKYLEEQGGGGLRRLAIRQLTSYLRLWDRAGAGRVDRYLANSQTTARRIRKYYGQESRVVFPPVTLKDLKPGRGRGDFFLCVGSLARYKRFDLAIEAANALGVRLVISGEGPDRSRLERLAGPTVEFTGYSDRTELAGLYRGARALVHPQVEDFGITVIEALASGTPVIAYRLGGATETLTEETGVFFGEQSVESLKKAITTFEDKDFDPKKLTAAARPYSRESFRKAIREEAKRLA